MGFKNYGMQVNQWVTGCNCPCRYKVTSMSKSYPTTFYKSFVEATEDMIEMLDFTKPIPFTCTPSSDVIGREVSDGKINYIVYGGKFRFEGHYDHPVQAAVEVAAMDNYKTEVTAGVKKKAEGPQGCRTAMLNRLLSLYDHYVYNDNPLQGESIDIYGNEIELGNLDWDDIALPETFRENIQENILWPVYHPEELKQAGLRTARGVLLEGERGMGKTMLSQLVASKIEGTGTFIKLRPSDVEELGWDYVFEVANTLEPSVLYLEDIDSFSSDRYDVSTFLTDLFDYLEGSGERGNVGFLVTTNVPDSIDIRFKNRPGRIDRRLVFDPSDDKNFGREWQKEVLGIYMDGNMGVTPDRVAEIVGNYDFTAAHLRELVYSARLNGIRRLGIDNGLDSEQLVLQEEDFEEAVEKMKSIV